MSLIDKAKSAIIDYFTDPEPDGPPPWSTRLKKAQYQSPSGQKVSFQYVDLEESHEKKTSVFETATGNGTYVQDNGHTSGRFPMLCICAGPDYDQHAAAFMGALLEQGEGILTHPIHGSITVVPTGEISRADALATEAGQALISVSFFETTGVIIGGESSIPQLFDAYSAAAADGFADAVDLGDAADKANFITKALKVINKTKDVMRKVSEGQAKIQKSVENVGDSLNRGIDLVVGTPIMLARQTQILIGEPARIGQAARAKLDAYGNLAGTILTQTFGGTSHESTADRNNFHYLKLNSGAHVASMARVSEKPDFDTKAKFLNAASQLRELHKSLQAWQDDAYTAIAQPTLMASAVDSGDADGQLSELVGAALSALVRQSFSAKNEIRETLDGDRTPLDLCFQLYGTTDLLDRFCNDNDFSGDELFLIPAGREIVYYV